MATCETNGHLYGQFSTKCIMCGEEKTDWTACNPRCAYYLDGEGNCRCAQFERPPAQTVLPGETFP